LLYTMQHIFHPQFMTHRIRSLAIQDFRLFSCALFDTPYPPASA
jgi:hypothetical protein